MVGASCQTCISIHALLAESDFHILASVAVALSFLSTLSLRRATLAGPSGPAFLYNFYPRSPCGERRVTVLGIQHRVGISIHALLAESDLQNWRKLHGQNTFLSTLSLRRATQLPTTQPPCMHRFLSTLSLRRATAKVHKTVGHFCAYETNFMGIASSC